MSKMRKLLAAAVLFSGAVALMLPDHVRAANKVEDAKKYTQQLKTTKDAKLKITALNELGDLGRLMKPLVADAMPDMIESLKDKDKDVRAAAARAIGKCDPNSDAVKGLVELLKSEKDESVKIAVINGLSSAGPAARDALPTLREIQKSEDKKSKLAKAAQDASRSIGAKKN